MISEYSGEPIGAVPASHRERLWRTRGKEGPSPHDRVWVGHYAGQRFPTRAGITRVPLRLMDQAGRQHDNVAFHAVFSIEHLVLVVFGHDADQPLEYEHGRGAQAALRAIWPTSKLVELPPVARFTMRGYMPLWKAVRGCIARSMSAGSRARRPPESRELSAGFDIRSATWHPAPMSNLHNDDDPTAWLGDPVGMHLWRRSSLVVSVPPGDRSALIISLVDAPTIDDPDQTATSYIRVDLAGARGLQETLAAAISQLEEHADS